VFREVHTMIWNFRFVRPWSYEWQLFSSSMKNMKIRKRLRTHFIWIVFLHFVTLKNLAKSPRNNLWRRLGSHTVVRMTMLHNVRTYKVSELTFILIIFWV
jgi:hypothetical protein